MKKTNHNQVSQNNFNETATRPSNRQKPLHPMGTVTTTEMERACLTPILISRSLPLNSFVNY